MTKSKKKKFVAATSVPYALHSALRGLNGNTATASTSTSLAAPEHSNKRSRPSKKSSISNPQPDPSKPSLKLKKWAMCLRLHLERSKPNNTAVVEEQNQRYMTDLYGVRPVLHRLRFEDILENQMRKRLFALLNKYKPESKAQRRQRLGGQRGDEDEDEDRGENKGEDEEGALTKVEVDESGVKTGKVYVLKFGVKHIAHLVESRKAQLVVIADDVNYQDLVIWLPALCRWMKVPYVIVRNEARLGTLVNKKQASAVALTEPRPEDSTELVNLIADLKAFQKTKKTTKHEPFGFREYLLRGIAGYGASYESILAM